MLLTIDQVGWPLRMVIVLFAVLASVLTYNHVTRERQVLCHYQHPAFGGPYTYGSDNHGRC